MKTFLNPEKCNNNNKKLGNQKSKLPMQNMKQIFYIIDKTI